MKRREFGRTLVRGLAGAGVAGSTSTSTIAATTARVRRKNTLMHVGGDYHSVAGGPGADITGKENLEYNLRHGVKHLTVTVRSVSEDGAWDLDELKRMKDNCDKYGVVFEAIRMDHEYIRLRKGPERDRRLDNIIGNIQRAAQVGVKIITHHWRVIPIRRNRRMPGRGGVTYTGFKLEDNWEDLPVGELGRVTSHDYWERITYFLENVIPAAREYDVRLPAILMIHQDFPLVIKAWRTGTLPLFLKQSNGTNRLSTALTMVFNYVWVQRERD